MKKTEALFVGLGAMGGPMAKNLARGEDIALRLYDTRPGAYEDFADLPAIPVDSLADGLEGGVEVVLLCLPNIDFVEEVVAQILAAGTLPRTIVDLSTSDVDRTIALGARCAERGVEYLDAPVTRGRPAAHNGTVQILAGGDDTVIDRLEPLFHHFGTDVVHCGPIGSGQCFKIINNMVTMMNGYALAGATAVARANGLDSAKVLQAMRTGSATSFSLVEDPGRCLEADTFPPGKFSTVYARKDVRLAMALAERGGVAVAGLNEVEDLLRRTAEIGYADDYYPVMVRALLP